MSGNKGKEKLKNKLVKGDKGAIKDPATRLLKIYFHYRLNGILFFIF